MVLIVPPRQDISFESHTTGGAYRKLVAEFKGNGLDSLFHSLEIDGVTPAEKRCGADSSSD